LPSLAHHHFVPTLAGDLAIDVEHDGKRETLDADSFAALVYPEMVRRILHEAVIEQDCTDPSVDDNDWPGRWLTYACNLPGVPEPQDGSDERARA
jgi:hypothetical protein